MHQAQLLKGKLRLFFFFLLHRVELLRRGEEISTNKTTFLKGVISYCKISQIFLELYLDKYV